jgi:BRCT domain type II-containing protein
MSTTITEIKGKYVVVTGKLTLGTRNTINEKIVLAGAHPIDNVTRFTNLLVVGTDPGDGKLQAAKRWGIPTCTEAEFRQLLAGQAITPNAAAATPKPVKPQHDPTDFMKKFEALLGKEFVEK